MLNLKKLIPIIAVVLIALGVNLEQFGIDLGALTGNGSNTGQVEHSRNNGAQANHGKQWSSTKPEINLWHIFANARIKSIRSKPNSKGVYTANIEIRDGNQWKGKFSSFFPDRQSNPGRVHREKAFKSRAIRHHVVESTQPSPFIPIIEIQFRMNK